MNLITGYDDEYFVDFIKCAAQLRRPASDPQRHDGRRGDQCLQRNADVRSYADKRVFVDGDFHKYASMYRCGMLGEIIAEQIDRKSENTPANVLILEVEDIDSKGYSVFCSSAADSFFRGQYYRWKHRFASPEEIYCESLPSVPSQQEIMQFADAYRVHSIDCVWVIEGTNVTVIEL